MAGGRSPRIGTADIVRVGRALGLDALSVKAVAAELEVTAAALYRHVEGRWDLERLVGESLLAELVLHDDPRHGIEQHLLSFALQLRAYALDHRGLARYLQLLFPAATRDDGCSPSRSRRSSGAVTPSRRRSSSVERSRR